MKGLPQLSRRMGWGVPGGFRDRQVAGEPADWTPLALNPVRAYHAPWDLLGNAPADVLPQWQNAGVLAGDPVDAMTDWSPAAMHATQEILSKQALIVTDAQGLHGSIPSYKYDGLDDAYNGQPLSLFIGDLQIFWVGQPTTTAVKIVWEHGPNANSSPGQWLLSFAPTTVQYASRIIRNLPSSGRHSSIRGGFADLDPHIVSIEYYGTHDSHVWNIDGVSGETSRDSNGDPVGLANDTLWIGSRLGGTTAPFQGLMTSFWIFQGLTPSQITQVYNWLSNNCGF